MEMHSTQVILICLILAWNCSALPCGSLSAGETHDVGSVTCPEEVIVLTISEGRDDDGGTLESVGQSYRISTDELSSSDHSLSGEVIESADNGEGISEIQVKEADPLSDEVSDVSQEREYYVSDVEAEAITAKDEDN